MMSSLSSSLLYNFFKKTDKYSNSSNHITENNHKFTKKKINDDGIVHMVQDPLLPFHLDLIKFQNDTLNDKNKQLVTLGLENEKIKDDLEALKKELEHQKNINGQLHLEIDEKDHLIKKSISRGRPKKYPDKSDDSLNVSSDSSDFQEPNPKKFCTTTFVPHLTDKLYPVPKYTLEYEYLEESEQKCIQVPSWRLIDCPPSRDKEGIEDSTDEAFTKRHDDHAIKEKKRKKWDLQKMREEVYRVRLLKKMEARKPQKQRKIKEVHSMFPNQEKVQAIEMCESHIPVNVFGHTIPKLKRETFRLPWIKKEIFEP